MCRAKTENNTTQKKKFSISQGFLHFLYSVVLLLTRISLYSAMQGACVIITVLIKKRKTTSNTQGSLEI